MRLNKINVVFLHKISCIRQFENKFSLRSFAFSLQQKAIKEREHGENQSKKTACWHSVFQ